MKNTVPVYCKQICHISSVHINLMEIDEYQQNSGQSKEQKWKTGFCTQYSQLTIRTFKQSKSVIFNKFKVLETVVMTVLLSLIWKKTNLWLKCLANRF
jgi:hypothetical protein